MYIGAKTEYGDTVVWTGSNWSEYMSDAMSYGTLDGHYEMGSLEADYVDCGAFSGPSRTYNGVRIVSIFEL